MASHATDRPAGAPAVIVHQVLSGAGPVDAVTSQARAFRALFAQWGWGGADHAVSIDPRMDGSVSPLSGLDPGPGDVLLVHYSAYAPRLRAVLDLPNPTLLLSHNVTPARWFWDHDPAIAVRCALGRRHLPAFVAGSDVVAGVSEYNARELQTAGATAPLVIPVLFDPARWGPPGPDTREGPPVFLFVGRLTPHKRQDEAIRAVAAYRRHVDADARLVLVGEPLNPRYREALVALAEKLAPGAVVFESGLSSEALAARYRQAHAFLCLSEHEGFCVPLLEAFHFGVPVLARPVGGVPEVAADAALLVEDEDLAVVCELMGLIAGDEELRDQLRRRGRARLGHFSAGATAARMRAALEQLAEGGPAGHHGNHAGRAR